MNAAPTTGTAALDQDRWSGQRAARPTGIEALDAPAALGVLTAADVHTATRLAALSGESEDSVILALALAVRALRHGSVALDLHTVADDVAASLLAGEAEGAPAPVQETGEPVGVRFPWPEPEAWLDAVRASRLAARGVLHVEFDRVLLGRYRAQEQTLARALADRAARPAPEVDAAALEAGLDRLFGDADGEDADQRAACRIAATTWTSVLTGGPGTGKTHTVARLLAVLGDQSDRAGRPAPRVALAAPTARAAAGLRASVQAAAQGLEPRDAGFVGDWPGSTLHRLLGTVPGRTAVFRHGRQRPLPHDVVVVDESSMVSLTLMTRLVEALRPDARLILVGDADQLASVEAGAVLADVVAGWRETEPSPVGRLRHSRRFGSQIGDLARAVLEGRADDALGLLRDGGDTLTLLSPAPEAPDSITADLLREDLLDQALRVRTAALAGDAAQALRLLGRDRLLCVHRGGSLGVSGWNQRVRGWVQEATGEPPWAWRGRPPGRPLLITRNDPRLGVSNGDVGVVVLVQDRPMAAFGDPQDPLLVPPGRLEEVTDMYAMTVHKAQGAQADRVHVLLPATGAAGAVSPLLTRELFYTALTRARERVVVVASEDAVRHAVLHPARRASTLRERLASD